MEKEYIIFCDESDASGDVYSNFYGGIIVKGSQIQRIESALQLEIHRMGLNEEIKWNKVNELYLKAYSSIMTIFFDEVRSGNIKVRIMFRENRFVPRGLSKEQRENSYFLLYYQFIKHAFGLRALAQATAPVGLRLYFDQFPDTKEKAGIFKAYLKQLFTNNVWYAGGSLKIMEEDITEVRSHDHILLQCLDVVLGAMTFRLNQKHMVKPVGALRRGKRTRAKQKLYKAILAEIRTMRPNFNIGISTGRSGAPNAQWEEPYLHWSFKPANHDRQ